MLRQVMEKTRVMLSRHVIQMSSMSPLMF